MRRWILLLAFVVLLVGAGRLSAQSRDEQAIRALLDRAFQASNSVDEKVAKQILADQSASGGPYFPPFVLSINSAPELSSVLSQLLASLTARSFATTGPVNVRLDKNLAWATYTWRAGLTFKDGSRQTAEGRTTATFVREGKNWKATHVHSSLPASLPPTGAALEAEAQAIMKIERHAWEALRDKKVEGLADYFAEDASIFNESQAYRLRGKAEIVRALEAWLRQGELRSYQMLDPQVQVFGNNALLTYYFTESGVSGGKEFSNAGKITMVFVKQGAAWRALHEHRSVNR